MRPDPHPSDYPERLRRVDVDSAQRPLMLEAADKIERLCAALTSIREGTKPGGRDLNSLGRDLHLAHDIARAALEQNADLSQFLEFGGKE